MNKKQFYRFDGGFSLFSSGIISKGGYLSVGKIL
jgi:hypothetical protein